MKLGCSEHEEHEQKFGLVFKQHSVLLLTS